MLHEVVDVEAATREQAGLPVNPIAQLRAVQMQLMLGLLSKAANPINPVDLVYQEDLARATDRVLSGQQSPETALLDVQSQVLVAQHRLAAQYGIWNW